MRRRIPSGFTLIEIIVVTGILVTLILFLLSAVVSSQKLTRDSAERQAARAQVYAKLAEMRALLRSADISGTDDTTKDFQFSTVLAMDTKNGTTAPAEYTGITIGATTWGTELVDILNNETGTLAQGYMTIVTFVDDPAAPASVNEDLANSEFDLRGLATDDTIDIDADLDADETAVLVEDLQLIPVLIRLEWKPGTWRPGDPVASFQVAGLLY